MRLALQAIKMIAGGAGWRAKQSDDPSLAERFGEIDYIATTTLEEFRASSV